MGGWEKFKILVKKKKKKKERWRCRIINGGEKRKKKIKEIEKGKMGCSYTF